MASSTTSVFLCLLILSPAASIVTGLFQHHGHSHGEASSLLIHGRRGPRLASRRRDLCSPRTNVCKLFAEMEGENDSGSSRSGSDTVEEPIRLSDATTKIEAPSTPPPSMEPSLTQTMRMMGTSPRRIFLSLGSASAFALAANFVGITSGLLSAMPEELVERSGLDYVYPRGDSKRVGVPGSCSFLIPKDWVADTGLALAQAQRRAKALDYSMTPGRPVSGSTLPDAAYGPPGRLDSRGLSNGDTNVSVIVNDNLRNFSLAGTLGTDPFEAAEKLLSAQFGPSRKITILSAVEELRRGDVPVYQFEYRVDRGERAIPLRAISVVAGSRSGDAFVTLTVVAPAVKWEDASVDERLRRVAESFTLT